MRLFGSKRGLSRPYYSRYALKLKAAGRFDGQLQFDDEAGAAED